MDMGLTGKRALVLGASKGLGFGSRKVSPAKVRVSPLRAGPWRVPKAPRTRSAITLALYLRHREDDQVDALVRDVVAALGRRHPGAQLRRPASGQGTRRLVRPMAQLIRGDVRQSRADRRSVASWHDRAEIRPHHLGDFLRVIQPIPNLAISNAIRPALVGWGKSLAAEVASSGVTVNAIAPGRISTDRLKQLDAANAERTGRSIDDVAAAARAGIPAGRYGEIEEFAAAAVSSRAKGRRS